MIDNTTLQIEELKLLRGSYKEAVIEFCGKHDIYDYEDLIEALSPILVDKIKQEYIRDNYIPHLKRETLLDP